MYSFYFGIFHTSDLARLFSSSPERLAVILLSGCGGAGGSGGGAGGTEEGCDVGDGVLTYPARSWP